MPWSLLCQHCKLPPSVSCLPVRPWTQVPSPALSSGPGTIRLWACLLVPTLATEVALPWGRVGRGEVLWGTGTRVVLCCRLLLHPCQGNSQRVLVGNTLRPDAPRSPCPCQVLGHLRRLVNLLPDPLHRDLDAEPDAVEDVPEVRLLVHLELRWTHGSAGAGAGQSWGKTLGSELAPALLPRQLPSLALYAPWMPRPAPIPSLGGHLPSPAQGRDSMAAPGGAPHCTCSSTASPTLCVRHVLQVCRVRLRGQAGHGAGLSLLTPRLHAPAFNPNPSPSRMAGREAAAWGTPQGSLWGASMRVTLLPDATLQPCPGSEGKGTPVRARRCTLASYSLSMESGCSRKSGYPIITIMYWSCQGSRCLHQSCPLTPGGTMLQVPTLPHGQWSQST